jgi:hypothetical protein
MKVMSSSVASGKRTRKSIANSCKIKLIPTNPPIPFGMEKYIELSNEEIEYVVNTLMLWIQREMSKD